MIERGSQVSGKIPVAEWVYAEDYDQLRAAVKTLVEKSKSLLALTDCLLGDSMTRGTEPVEIREARQAIAAVERLEEVIHIEEKD